MASLAEYNWNMSKILEVRQLQKRFQLHLLDGRVIEPLHNISFEVERGHVFMISGRSGVGKTSILKCIYRTYLTSGGEIWYASEQFGRIDIASASEEVVLALRERELGYCSQFLKVLPRVAALDVAAEPLIRRGLNRAEAQAEAAQWLRRLGIEESRWQAYPITFSGGEQQRLNIARAFIAAPHLLLLDEPTASLDAKSKEIVLTLIAEAKAAGVTILTVSHDLAVLSSLADDSYTMQSDNLEPETVS
jgi:alpha-D-ribose 1-methylphosphonate 5-triphosphate synthase subunit PhnL